MDNQHRKIKGCRELSQHEIDLANRIKAKGEELMGLQGELVTWLNRQNQVSERAATTVPEYTGGGEYTPEHKELRRLDKAEPFRWASIGKTDIQTGIMALVRAVLQPEGV